MRDHYNAPPQRRCPKCDKLIPAWAETHEGCEPKALPVRLKITGTVGPFREQVVQMTIRMRDGWRLGVSYAFPAYPLDVIPNLAPLPRQGVARAWRELRRGYRKHVRLSRAEAAGAVANPGETVVRYTPSQPAPSADAAMARWVPVTERLPAMCDTVVVLNNDGKRELAWRSAVGWYGQRDALLTGVTHWMPLPAHPEVKL